MNPSTLPIKHPAAPPPLPRSTASVTVTAQGEISPKPPTPKHAGWPKLPVLLRWLGTITLISSALTFVLSDWMTTNQVLRYAQFLGFTALLSACGWFCITRWRDDKGARTFFALTAALLPAHFAQLGGMFFANARDHASHFTGMKEVFRFEVLPDASLWATFGLAMIILIPLTYFGFAAMARQQARALTLIYAAANALLLLPIRNPNGIALIGLIMLVALYMSDRRYFAPQSRMKTWDGRAMRTLLFAPYGLLIGRNLLLHGDHSNLLISLLLATISVVCFSLLPQVAKNKGSREALRLFAILPALGAWGFIANSDWLFASFTLGRDTIVPMLLLPWCCLSAIMSAKLGPTAKAVRVLAATTALIASLAQLVVVETAMASLLAVFTGLAVILGGYAMRERSVFRIGLIGLGLGLAYHLRFAAELYQGPFLWVSLGATGVFVILASSFIERFGPRSRDWFRTFHHKVSDWK